MDVILRVISHNFTMVIDFYTKVFVRLGLLGQF